MRFLFYFISFILSNILFACSSGGESEMRRQVILQTVEDRIDRYKIEKYNACQRKVLKKAGAIADSILLAEARLRRDTANRPVIPEKPELPQIIPIKDSIPIEPFFRDSTLEFIIPDSSEIKN